MYYTLFGKGKEKILEAFYQRRDEEIYFNEMLRETGLTPTTTLKHLQGLAKAGMIIVRKKTANTFYLLNPSNPMCIPLLSYFDYKRLCRLNSARKRAIHETIEALDEKPIIAIVFGSTAKNTYTKESDLDLLLVYNKKTIIGKKVFSDVEATTGISIQAVAIDFAYFKEQNLKGEDKVIAHAIKTGFVIIGHYYFYNEVLS